MRALQLLRPVATAFFVLSTAAPAMSAAVVPAASVSVAGAAEVRGIPVLPTSTNDVVARMDISPAGPLAKRIAISETTLNGRRLRAYGVDMTKRMHLIVVSDDMRTFLHVHPALDRSGVFRITVTVPSESLYHFYADTEPEGYGHRVFRFDVPYGDGPVVRHPALTQPPGRIVHVAPYDVALDRTTLPAGSSSFIAVVVTRNGRPATDLHPYLGGMAHAVFVNTSDLSYLHVHPVPVAKMPAMSGMQPNGAGRSTMVMDDDMAMETMPEDASVDPHMTLGVMLENPGTYVLWFQFRGGARLYVARFVVDARASRP